MKKFNIFLLIGIFLSTITSCVDDQETLTQNFAQYEDDSSVSLVENSGDIVPLSVILGGPQSEDVTINFDISGNADPTRFNLSQSSIVIPAGQTSGLVNFQPVDNDDIDGDVEVVITLSNSSSIPVGILGLGSTSVSKSITIVDDNVPCNDYTLEITTDQWANETHWYIVNNDTNVRVLQGGGSLSDGVGQVITEEVYLENGCYTFTIWDEYGDGMVSTQGDGSYILSCGALVAAQGSGVFDSVGLPGATGADLPVGFGFQQQPTTDLVGFVEATVFCVNQ